MLLKALKFHSCAGNQSWLWCQMLKESKSVETCGAKITPPFTPHSLHCLPKLTSVHQWEMSITWHHCLLYCACSKEDRTSPVQSSSETSDASSDQRQRQNGSQRRKERRQRERERSWKACCRASYCGLWLLLVCLMAVTTCMLCLVSCMLRLVSCMLHLCRARCPPLWPVHTATDRSVSNSLHLTTSDQWEDYQNCSVQYCVTQLCTSIQRRHYDWCHPVW